MYFNCLCFKELERLVTMKNTTTRPLPPDIACLHTITAEPWVEIDSDTVHSGLEGPAFDEQGNFYVCRSSPPPGPPAKIIKVTVKKEKTVFFDAAGYVPVGIAVHKDGRFFVACLSGQILIISGDGNLLRKLLPMAPDGSAMSVNDLVFDRNGNLYFTDFRGLANNPIGGVYRYDAVGDYNNLTLIAGGLASPNGISMSPEGNALWIGESGRNAVLRIDLDDNGKMAPFLGLSYVYWNTGLSGPDSNKVDADGNLYQPMMPDGRVLVLNRYGIPVANVIVPGREEGRNLMTPNLVMKHGTKEAYLCVAGSEGSWIYRFEALAEAQVLYQQT